MKAKGNGEIKTCVENLTSIVRGEIPFDRIRGIDARILDSPEGEAADNLQSEAQWNIDTYEPRAGVVNVVVTVDKKEDGGALTLNVAISNKE